MKRKSKWPLLFFFILFLFAQGCYGNDGSIKAETPIPAITLEQVRTPTTPPTALPTKTVVATLNPSDQEAEIERLMQTNDNCSGFCFWGIRSGETSFSSAIDFFRKFNVVKNIEGANESQEYVDSVTFSEDKIYIRYDILQKGETAEIKDITIQGIGRTDTSPDKWTAFTLANYLKRNGKPEEFLITMWEGPEGRISYALILNYKDWVVTYSGKQIAIKPDPIRACPLGKHNIDRIDINSARNANLGWTVAQSKITGLSDDDFFKKLTEGSENTCFTIDFEQYSARVNDRIRNSNRWVTEIAPTVTP